MELIPLAYFIEILSNIAQTLENAVVLFYSEVFYLFNCFQYFVVWFQSFKSEYMSDISIISVQYFYQLEKVTVFTFC